MQDRRGPGAWGRAPEPAAAIIGSRPVKAAGTAGKPSRGHDAGTKISDRRRHIAVDTTGLPLTVLITAAGVQDRDEAEPLLRNLRKAFMAWITRCRRAVRDCERLPGHHETIIRRAMTITMTRRLTRRRPAVQPRAA